MNLPFSKSDSWPTWQWFSRFLDNEFFSETVSKCNIRDRI